MLLETGITTETREMVSCAPCAVVLIKFPEAISIYRQGVKTWSSAKQSRPRVYPVKSEIITKEIQDY